MSEVSRNLVGFTLDGVDYKVKDEESTKQDEKLLRNISFINNAMIEASGVYWIAGETPDILNTTYNERGNGVDYVVSNDNEIGIGAIVVDSENNLIGVWHDGVVESGDVEFYNSISLNNIYRLFSIAIKIRLVAKNLSGDSITPEDGYTKISAYTFGINKKLDSLRNIVIGSKIKKWEQASINNTDGNKYTNTTRIVCENINNTDKFVVCAPGFSACVFVYDGSEYKGTWSEDGTVAIGRSNFYQRIYLLGAQNSYGINTNISIVVRKNDNSAITIADGMNNVYVCDDSVDSNERLESLIDVSLSPAYGVTYEQGAINNVSGEEYLDTRFVRSGIIPNESMSVVCSRYYEVCAHVYNGNSYEGTWKNDGTINVGRSNYYNEIDVGSFIKVYGNNTKIRLVVKCRNNIRVAPDDAEKNVFISKKPQCTSADEVNILVIGNSFTQDEFGYVPALLKESFPDMAFNFGIAYKGAATLDDQVDMMTEDTPYPIYSEYNSKNFKWNNMLASISAIKLSDILKRHTWNIIIFNQKSTELDEETTISALKTLIDGYTARIKFPVSFGWLLAHALYGYEGTTDVVNWGLKKDLALAINSAQPISHIFASGTAIQNARTTSLNNLGERGHMVYDEGGHLQEGTPCLTAAYYNFMKICEIIGKPIRGVLGSQIVPDQDWVTAQDIPVQHGTSCGTSAAEIALAAKCAIAALKNPFEITDCSEM